MGQTGSRGIGWTRQHDNTRARKREIRMSSRNDFNIALQFLTRIPVTGEVDHSDEAFARSARFYPLVGIIVGLVAAGVFFVADMFLTDSVSALLALLAGVAVTGGLHEDGLADAADGLIGGKDRDHTLDIMRDHTVGVFGVLALISNSPSPETRSIGLI